METKPPSDCPTLASSDSASNLQRAKDGPTQTINEERPRQPRLFLGKKPLRIAVADDESFMRMYLQTILPRLGHEVVVVAETGRELIEKCIAAKPDLIITDVDIPELDGLQAVAAICAICPVPVIVISGYHGPEEIEQRVPDRIVAFLVKPIKHIDLELAIALAISRFEQMKKGSQDVEPVVVLRDQDSIDQAVRALAIWSGERPGEALCHLQKLAADQRLSLAEIAQIILAARDAQ